MWFGIVLGSVVALYLVYELGRLDGGYDVFAARQDRRDANAEIDSLEHSNALLRQKLADLETNRVSGQQERTELARTIGGLQDKIARLSQDLSFYRGIVANGEAAPGIKIERFDMSPVNDGKQFRVRFALMQTAQPEGTVSGTLQISLQGSTSGRPATLPMQEIATDKRAVTSFSFRFFEDIEQMLAVPAGFVPSDIVIEARVNRAGAMPLRQIFPWDAH
jgi:cell division protein FtsB